MGFSQLESGIQSFPPCGGCVQRFGSEVQGLAVMGLENKEAQGHSRESALEKRTDRGEVAQ